MCVVKKQFELLEFVLNSVCVDLKYNEYTISLLLLGRCACVECVHYVVMLSFLVCL